MVGLAAREQEPFCSIVRQIETTILEWVMAAVQIEREEDCKPLAALALTLVEGFVNFDALGDETTAAAALAGLTLVSGTCPKTSSPRCACSWI
ncbi:MAG: hypothetical protein EOM24_16590 [Chloroflexia bacterium]|nr:hypothetical protein [Chloroflexia bacterium]